MHALVRQIDLDGDGLLSLEEWSDCFAPLPESHPSTQPMLAALSLQPRKIRELFEGAEATQQAARAVSAASLANFKFKLKQPKGWTLVWTNKGSTSRQKLSIWSAESDEGGAFVGLKDTLVKKRSHRRVTLGHYAVAGYEPPGKASTA